MLNYDNGPGYDPLYANFANADITTNRALITVSAATKRVIVDDLLVTSEVAQDISLKRSSDNAVIIGPLYCPAGGLIPFTLRNTIANLPLGSNLLIFGTVAGNVKAVASYHEK